MKRKQKSTSVAPSRAIFLGPDNFFGPASGLGPLEYGDGGPARAIQGDRFHIPVDVSAVREVRLDIFLQQDVEQILVWFPSTARNSVQFEVASTGVLQLVVPREDAQSDHDAQDLCLRIETVPEHVGLRFNGLTLHVR